MPRLTAASVEKIKRPAKRQEIRDSLCPGLILVVQPTGSKSWQVRYRSAGKQRRSTLGTYDPDPKSKRGINLEAARKKARELLVQVASGEDPAVAAPEPHRDTVAALVDRYDHRHLSKLRSGATVRRELDRHFVAPFGDRDIQSVTKRELIDLLDKLVESGREISANRVRAYLSTFYRWLVRRDVIEVSPVASIARPVKERSRDRVLSDEEIRWLWRACDALGEPWGPLARFLLLTGQRRGEAVGMTDAEIDGGLWHLGADRTKNARAHVVPLSTAALAIVNRSGRIASPYIFTARGGRISGFNKGMSHLERAVLKAAEADRGEPVEIPRWTFHDLRRTAATGMARLGIPVHVVEAVLNHASGAISGVAGVYNRHGYEQEKRQALEAWARYVEQIVEGRPANVVRLEEARS